MKIFKIGEGDWIAANNEKEAITHFKELTGEEVDPYDVEQCSLKLDGMYEHLSLDEAIKELKELAQGRKIRERGVLKFCYRDGLMVWIPFEEVLKKHKGPFPCLLASTEW